MSIIKPDLTRVWAEGAPGGNVVDPDTTTPGKFSSGWQAEVPPFEHFNFLQKFFTEASAYFNEQGIAEWDTDTVYPVGGIAKGSDGTLYGCIIEQSGNDPVSDGGVNWQTASSIILMANGSTLEDAINDRTIYVDSVHESFNGLTVLDGVSYTVNGIADGSNVGGSIYAGRLTEPKSGHDGINIISPTVPPVSAQAGTTLSERESAFRLGTGETDPSGNGVFVRSTQKDANTEALISSGLLGLNRNSLTTGSAPTIKKPVMVLGDSVSHGAFADDLYFFGWTRILARMINAETGSRNFGFEPLIEVTGTTSFHSVVFNGWNDPDGAFDGGLSGRLYASDDISDNIVVSVPANQNKLVVWYIGHPAGGTFEIDFAGVIVATVDTSVTSNPYDFVVVDIKPSITKPESSFTITHTAGGKILLHGVSYYEDLNRPALENFSNSGRGVYQLEDEVIDYACENSSALIIALGLNDVGFESVMPERVDKLISSCNANNVKLYVVDFLWTREKSHPVRLELKRLFESVPSATYIPFPDYIKANNEIATASYLTSTIGLWADGSHPNKEGHVWIAETVGKAMGLSNNALLPIYRNAEYDYPMNFFGVIRNFDITDSASLSKCQLNGDKLSMYFSIKDGFSNPFPLGRQQIRPNFGRLGQIITGTNQVILPAVVNPSTGAIESTIEINPDGTMFIDVNTSATQDQTFSVEYKIKYLEQTI